MILKGYMGVASCLLHASHHERKKGFISVYLVMILGSLVMAIVMIINAACGFAARSIVDNVCALAGRSVLSEYQKDLYDRYGIFALRADDALLTRLSAFYVGGSLIGGKALVSPVLIDMKASGESYPALDVESFGKQVRRLAPAAALLKGDLLDLIISLSGDSWFSGVSDILGGDNKDDPEIDPQESAEKSFKKDSDRNSGQKVKGTVYRSLPSRLLGYSKRRSLLLSGGIRDLSVRAIIEDEYIMAMCSRTHNAKDDSFLECEVEYILYGGDSDAANRKALKMSLFTLRLALNEIKYLSETGEFLSATAASVALAVTEVRTLMSGGKVDGLSLDLYLRLLLTLIPREEKLARLMDVMELNLRQICGANFSFKNYAYGFDMNAKFLLKKRFGDVEKSFVYR